jgi:hypothetical protein
MRRRIKEIYSEVSAVIFNMALRNGVRMLKHVYYKRQVFNYSLTWMESISRTDD